MPAGASPSTDELVEAVETHPGWRDFGMDEDELRIAFAARAGWGGPATRPGDPRLLRRLRVAPRQAALGRQDPRLHRVDRPDRRGAGRPGALRPPDPRRPRRRRLARRPGSQARPGGDAGRRRGRDMEAPHRGSARRGTRGRPLPRAPLRGPHRRLRAPSAEGLRVLELGVRPRDARLPRARVRAPRRSWRDLPGKGGKVGRARSGSRPRAHVRAAARRPRRALAHRALREAIADYEEVAGDLLAELGYPLAGEG